ncbi:MAG: methyltransferase domain-containing protein, partial [Thermoguttaceae bacterium]
MSYAVWQILRCPRHPDRGHLRVSHAGGTSRGAAPSEGRLECGECGLVFPVVRGVIDMVSPLLLNDPTPFLQNESRQWDEHASRYDEARLKDVTYMSCIRAGLRALGPRRGEWVLDAGCGTGLGTRLLDRTGVSTIALDLSLASLERLLANLPQPGVPCVRADISRLPFANDVFDRLICANTLQHVPTWDLRRRCIEQFARVVRPGGTVVVTAHGFSASKRRAGWSKEGSAAIGYGTADCV